jgi:hypothetical protein
VTFQNTLLKYRDEKHGDSKMKDFEIRSLGATRGTNNLLGNSVSNNKPKGFNMAAALQKFAGVRTNNSIIKNPSVVRYPVPDVVCKNYDQTNGHVYTKDYKTFEQECKENPELLAWNETDELDKQRELATAFDEA